MENVENLRTLANTAFEANNHEQAYNYYSRLLELEPSDAKAWLGKGLSAGWISAPEDQKLDEVRINVQQAFKNGLEHDHKEAAADEIIKASRRYIKKAKAAFDAGVKEFDKKEIAPGVLLAVHNLGRREYQIDNGREQAPGWLKAIDLIEYAYSLAPSRGRYETAIAEIDNLLQHSEENADYLKHNKDEELNRLPRVLARRQQVIEEAKENVPDFAPKTRAPSKSSDGCVIATATFGDPGSCC